MLHVVSTRIAEGALGVTSRCSSVLLVQWQLSPWLGVLQVAAVLTVWIHACIGVHFWLRTKTWYAGWRPLFVAVALMLPTLALSGCACGRSHLRRLDVTALCRPRRAQLGPSPSPSAPADSFQRAHRTDVTGSDGA
jgi:adenylate cyclase